MANKTITALSAATTPLTGAEVLPVVQGGGTLNVSVSALTAGRTVALRNAVLTGGAAVVDIGAVGDTSYHYTRLIDNAGAGFFCGIDDSAGSFFGAGAFGRVLYSEGANPLKVFVNGAYRADYDVSGNYRLNTGNLVIGTAGKGVDFTANGGDILTQYDEGTWTPNQGAGLTVVGAFSSSGTFTRVGRQVTVRGVVSGATSVAIAASATAICSNLPFSASGEHCGTMANNTASTGGVVVAATTVVTAAAVMAATPSIFFTVTYQI
jgi:hypothetical protein